MPKGPGGKGIFLPKPPGVPTTRSRSSLAKTGKPAYVCRRVPPPSPPSIRQTLEFSSQAGNLATVRAFVRQFLGFTTLAEDEAELLVLGVDEACSNIIRHAYRRPQKTEEQPIILCCEQLRHGVRFRLRDFAAGADPASFSSRPLDRIEPGGLGLHLMRRAFDQVDYNLKKPGTELVLVKKFGKKKRAKKGA